VPHHWERTKEFHADIGAGIWMDKLNTKEGKPSRNIPRQENPQVAINI